MVHFWLIFGTESPKIEIYKIKTIQNALIFSYEKIDFRTSYCLCSLWLGLYTVNFWYLQLKYIFYKHTTCIPR